MKTFNINVKQKINISIFACLLIFVLSQVIGKENMTFIKNHDSIDISLLIYAEAIESKLMGEEGVKSKQTENFMTLVNNNDKNKFIELYNKSKNIHGRIYALVWFFDHEKVLYEKYKRDLLEHDSNQAVIIYHGDIILTQPLSDVFPLIESKFLKDHILP